MSPSQTSMPALHRTGSFDTLRLVAALMVFYSHHFALSGFTEPSLPGFMSFGSAAVAIFFGMSGLLVTRSALQRDAFSFIVARALRIVPGLAACIGLTVLAGCLITTLPAKDYLQHPQTLRYLGNVFVFWRPLEHGLPGVFEGGANHHVNGSLWTLPYEILCYVAVGLAAMVGRGALVILGTLAVAYVAAVFFGGTGVRVLVLLDAFDAHWLGLWVAAFAAGAALNWTTADRYGRILLAVTLVFLLVQNDRLLGNLVSMPFYAVAAVWLATRLNFDRVVSRIGDLSYGVYIYAFPCQQMMIRAFEGRSNAFSLSFVTALIATLLLAAASWFLLERRAIAAKKVLFTWVSQLRNQLPPSIAKILIQPAQPAPKETAAQSAA